MPETRLRHIAIEGCIGAGKTTWARKLSEARNSKHLLEDFDLNPFLPAFYKDPEANLLETELNFLLIHYHQLKNLRSAVNGEVISDFAFLKDKIFALNNIKDPSEMQVFDTLYLHLEEKLRQQDAIIFLKASDELVCKRIAIRNREIEQEIDTSYYSNLNATYNRFFQEYKGPVLVVDADRIDCISDPSSVDLVSNQIDNLLAAVLSKAK